MDAVQIRLLIKAEFHKSEVKVWFSKFDSIVSKTNLVIYFNIRLRRLF